MLKKEVRGRLKCVVIVWIIIRPQNYGLRQLLSKNFFYGAILLDFYLLMSSSGDFLLSEIFA